MRVFLRLLAAPTALALAVIAGCERDDPPRVYIAPKDAAAPAVKPDGAMPLSGTMASGNNAPVSWTVPASWTQQPGGLSDMRYATFQVGPADDKLELTVVPLPQGGGSTLDQVNRWRGQLSLPPVAAAELDRMVVKVPLPGTPGGQAEMVDIQGPPPTDPAGPPAKRMLAAIVPYKGQVWFFKMAGSAALIEKHAQEFSAFIASLRFAPPDK